ncbi:MAG: DUF924 family protein [Pseudomonadota bacterium]|nr:DUF924 family protein [Pseudomonadota bacterium]
MNEPASDILEFWFSERVSPQWFNASKELDNEILQRFGNLWHQALNNELNTWANTPEGALALVILLDQFPLNMFRGQAKSFKTEALAIKVTKHTVSQGFDKKIPKSQLMFLYMPLMHSENIEDQNLSIQLFTQAQLTQNLRFANHHKELIQKFGRFPHRNAILERTSTDEEIKYLNSKHAFTG